MIRQHTSKALAFGVSLLLLSLLHTPAQGATFCVSTASELDSALLTAQSNGEDDLVRVVQGTYTGNFIYFSTEAHNLTIEGGYIPGCSSRELNPANTVLDANHVGTPLVLVSDQSADFTVDGLTLQNGNVIYAGYGPGGLSVTTGGDVTLTNNMIHDNSSYNDGGGVAVYGFGSTFEPTKNFTLTNNTIYNNFAGGAGGGFYVSFDGITVTLTNNTIYGNSADFGGGVYVAGSIVTLTNNTIFDNEGRINGGGIWLSLYEESGPYLDVAYIYNNIVWANSAPSGADLYLNNDGDLDTLPSSINLFNNDFDWSTISIKLPFPIDPSNLNNVDPLFVNPESGDLHLQPGSPVINRGDNEAPGLPATDKDGNPRIQDGVVDMGAYEFSGAAGAPEIEVEPSKVNFWVVKVGKSKSKLFRIQNGGNADLEVSAIRVSPAPPFTLQSPTPPFTVAPGGTVEVTLSFTPTRRGMVWGSATIVSNDADEPEVKLPLTGIGW